MAIDSVHDFLNHEHTICSSKIEKHLHEKDLDCKLHLMKKGDSFLTTAHYKIITNIIIYNNNLQYSFLKNHYQIIFLSKGTTSLCSSLIFFEHKRPKCKD